MVRDECSHSPQFEPPSYGTAPLDAVGCRADPERICLECEVERARATGHQLAARAGGRHRHGEAGLERRAGLRRQQQSAGAVPGDAPNGDAFAGLVAEPRVEPGHR